jgi:argininosuccinate synthase
MNQRKVVLAYSGGLDTSFCIKYLSAEKGLEVHALTVDTGGFSPEELEQMSQRASQLGAASFQAVDAVPSYYDQCLRYLIYGNVLRNGTYPLSVSAERVFQALETARYAQQIGAQAVAHGSTGAGNDQVRFDLAFEVLGQGLEIITPIRDLKLSRQQEVDYLQQHGIAWSAAKGRYSINQGIWGTSVGGAETLTSDQPLPETAYPSQLQQSEPRQISLQFEKGELVGLDGKKFAHPTAAIRALQEIAAPYAIGRDIHVGDTIIGIKGRVGFEAAAPLIIIKAHHLLEKHVLTKWQQYWKEQLANWYGMLLHEGQYLEPVMRNIETFLEDTQQSVSGQVHVRLHPYRFELLGIESEYDLMNSGFGQYGEMNKAWSGEDVKGFTRILANQLKIHHFVHQQKEQDHD